jgi:hypothetical protein
MPDGLTGAVARLFRPLWFLRSLWAGGLPWRAMGSCALKILSSLIRAGRLVRSLRLLDPRPLIRFFRVLGIISLFLSAADRPLCRHESNPKGRCLTFCEYFNFREGFDRSTDLSVVFTKAGMAELCIRSCGARVTNRFDERMS